MVSRIKGDENEARKLFRQFHEREPNSREIQTLGMRSLETVLKIGKVVAIVYEPVNERVHYEHKFSRVKPPEIYVSSDGKQVYIVGGVYRFTDRGFRR